MIHFMTTCKLYNTDWINNCPKQTFKAPPSRLSKETVMFIKMTKDKKMKKKVEIKWTNELHSDFPHFHFRIKKEQVRRDATSAESFPPPHLSLKERVRRDALSAVSFPPPHLTLLLCDNLLSLHLSHR